MIVRAIAGIVLGGALSTGALYGAYEYLGLTSDPHSLGAPADEGEGALDARADIGPDEPQGGGAADEMEGEPPFPLPYGDEERAAARWLLEVLAGTGPYEARDRLNDLTVVVDLAGLAASASRPQAERPAQPQLNDSVTVYAADCQAGHVMLACSLESSTEVWESENAQGDHWNVVDTQTYRFAMQPDENGDWVVDADGVGLYAAG